MMIIIDDYKLFLLSVIVAGSRFAKIEYERLIELISEISFIYPETWRMLLSTGCFCRSITCVVKHRANRNGCSDVQDNYCSRKAGLLSA